jgi:hypothetical protein
MDSLPPVKSNECDEIEFCYYCAHAIYTDRYWDEVLGWYWNGHCPNCARDALGRDAHFDLDAELKADETENEDPNED